MSIDPDIEQVPEVMAFLQDADHIDVKTVEGDLSMREFIARLLSYQPGWITFLYRVRWLFVRLLGMKQSGVPQAKAMRAQDVSMAAGEAAAFFQVVAAEDECFWVAGASESHLEAKIGVVVASLANGRRRFHVITIVHYHNWIGPVYFNVIRPFHHLVVGGMVKFAVQEPVTTV